MSESPVVHTQESLVSLMLSWKMERIRNNPSSALDVALPLFAEFGQIGWNTARAHLQLVIGTAQAVLGQLNSAEARLVEARQLFVIVDDDWGIATSIIRLNLVAFSRQDMRTALVELPIALKLARKIGDHYLIMSALNDLGVIYRFDHQIEASISCLVEAIERAEALEHDLMRLICRINLAETLCKHHDCESGLELTHWCLEFIGTHPEYAHLDAYCNHHLATCEQDFGNTEQALVLLDRSIARSRAIADPVRLAHASFDEGVIRAEMGDRDRAILAFQRSVDSWHQIEFSQPPLTMLLAIWWIESLNEAWTRETVDALIAGLARAESRPDLTINRIYDALAESCEKLGDLELALEYARTGRRVSERYWRDTARRQSHLAAKKHQTEEAQRQMIRERRQREELSRALEHVVTLNQRNEELVSQLTAQSQRLEVMASRDALTQLNNRGHFDKVLVHRLIQAQETGQALSVMMTDIDDFKQINDHYSHRLGDIVLKMVSQVFMETTREMDFVARYGGEEFAFILPDTNAIVAANLAERLRDQIAAYSWDVIAPGLSVTLSIGVVTAPPAKGISAESIMILADTLLYEAKAAGKDRIRSEFIRPQESSLAFA